VYFAFFSAEGFWMEKREKMSYCDGCRHYFKFNSKYSRYYCLAHEHERRIIPSEHKPSFCIGHTKGKVMKETATPVWGSPSSSEVKLEVGQIWQGDSGNFRIILCVGKEKVFYDLVDKEDVNRMGACEHVTAIKDFISTYARKLLPCWPEKKKVKRARALILGHSNALPYVPCQFFKDDTEIKEMYFDIKEIIEFPYGEWKEFLE
jgi:hypothetical protein